MAQRSAVRTARRTTPRAPRRAGVPVLAAALALGLAGCSATNTVTTAFDYSPSDGVDARLGDVSLGNLIVLTAEEGAPGTVVGFVTNSGGTDARITLQVADAGASDPIDVDRGATVLLGPDADETVDVGSVPVVPGGKVDVVVTSDVGGTTTVRVPVLDGSLEEYADLVP